MLSNSSAGKNGFGVELVLMDWEKIAVNLYRLIDKVWEQLVQCPTHKFFGTHIAQPVNAQLISKALLTKVSR